MRVRVCVHVRVRVRVCTLVSAPSAPQVSKLVSELDALYRSSEQQLKKAEQGRKPAINTDQPAELIKDAKKLPDLRVREKTCPALCWHCMCT